MRLGLIAALSILSLTLSCSVPAWAVKTIGTPWPNLRMTYMLMSDCNPSPRATYIRDGISAWERWLPEANWTEVPSDSNTLLKTFWKLIPWMGGTLNYTWMHPVLSNGTIVTSAWVRVVFDCIATNTVLGSTVDASTIVHENDTGRPYIDQTIITFGTWVWNFPYPNGSLVQVNAIGTVAYETGHALGLPDEFQAYNGIMSAILPQNCVPPRGTCQLDPVFGIPMPAHDDIASILAEYGVSTTSTTTTATVSVSTTPVAEFPTGTIGYAALVALLATVVMLQKLRRNLGLRSHHDA